MKTFVLVNRIKDNEIRWFELKKELDQNILCNKSSWERHILMEEKHAILEYVKAENWEQLLTQDNLKKTSHYKKLVEDSKNETLQQGWLDPSGRIHYCRYQNHSSYAMDVLFTTDIDLQNKGWIHMYIVGSELCIYGNRRYTRAQAYTLKEKCDIEIDEDDIIYN